MSGFKGDYNAATAVAGRGSDTYADANAHTGRWSALLVLSAAVIAAITDDSNNPSTVLLATSYPAGSYLGASNAFTSVQLTSGTVQMIRA